jgi:hypothetical protein
LEKYQSQEVALNKLEKKHLRDYETGLSSPVAPKVLEKIFKDLAVQKIFIISEPCAQNLKKPSQGTFLQKN